MNAKTHIVLSAAAGAALGSATGSPKVGVACFLAGWLVDVDHILDFTLKWGPWEAIVRLLRMGVGKKNDPDSCYLIFHGYEVSVLLLAVAAQFPHTPWLMGAALGHLFHLFLDQATNIRGFRPHYFLCYRAYHNFSAANLFRAHPARAAEARPVSGDRSPATTSRV